MGPCPCFFRPEWKHASDCSQMDPGVRKAEILKEGPYTEVHLPGQDRAA